MKYHFSIFRYWISIDIGLDISYYSTSGIGSLWYIPKEIVPRLNVVMMYHRVIIKRGRNFDVVDHISDEINILIEMYASLREIRVSNLLPAQIAKFMGPAWGPPGSCRPQMGPKLAPLTFLSGWICWDDDMLLKLMWMISIQDIHFT